VSGMSGDFPVQLATRLPDWLAGGLLRCIVLLVLTCVASFFKFHEPDTRDSLRSIRGQVASILVRHVRHARFPRDILARMFRGCREETASVEFELIAAAKSMDTQASSRAERVANLSIRRQ